MSYSSSRAPGGSKTPKQSPIGADSAAAWIIVVGALFGLVTMIGLFAFAYLAASNPYLCSSFSFQLLAAGFSLGAALAGSFIGGGAGAKGKSTVGGFNLLFGLGGGAALLVVTLVVFSVFAPKGCDVLGTQQLQLKLQTTTAELDNTKTILDNSKAAFERTNGDLASAIADNTKLQDAIASLKTQVSDAESKLNLLTSAKGAEDKIIEDYKSQLSQLDAKDKDDLALAASAKTEIKSLLAAISTAFPDADKLSQSVASIVQLVTNHCSGGRGGEDGLHADAIRSISTDAANRIASARVALSNIQASVPPNLMQ